MLSTAPKGLIVLLAIAGSLTILSGFHMLGQGNILPIAVIVTLAFLVYVTYKRLEVTVNSQPPPTPEDTQLDVFRSMEPADQTRVNVWYGILQDDVFANKTGPIGNFIGNYDYVKNAPLYAITA
jgi:hypothetical protein